MRSSISCEIRTEFIGKLILRQARHSPALIGRPDIQNGTLKAFRLQIIHLTFYILRLRVKNSFNQ